MELENVFWKIRITFDEDRSPRKPLTLWKRWESNSTLSSILYQLGRNPFDLLRIASVDNTTENRSSVRFLVNECKVSCPVRNRSKKMSPMAVNFPNDRVAPGAFRITGRVGPNYVYYYWSFNTYSILGNSILAGASDYRIFDAAAPCSDFPDVISWTKKASFEIDWLSRRFGFPIV